MIWLMAAGAIVVGGVAGFVVARRYARNTTALLVLSAIVLVVGAGALFNALAGRDQEQAILTLCATFGALTGLRFGSKVMVDLLTGNVGSSAAGETTTEAAPLDQPE